MTVPTEPSPKIRGRTGLLFRGIVLCTTALVAVPLPVAAQPAAIVQPQVGQVVAGAARISQNSTVTRIDQASPRAVIDWRGFDVGSGQQVQFQQPSTTSVTLNRVTGPGPSRIAGKVTANGQVVLVNPAGVLFTKGAQVDTQSVIVSAAGISNRSFMSGQMVFDRPAQRDAAVVDRGPDNGETDGPRSACRAEGGKQWCDERQAGARHSGWGADGNARPLRRRAAVARRDQPGDAYAGRPERQGCACAYNQHRRHRRRRRDGAAHCAGGGRCCSEPGTGGRQAPRRQNW